MGTKDEVKRIKFIFFLFILLSNAIIFMLAQNENTSPKSTNIYIRENFIYLKINAEAKTIIAKERPYTLISKNKRTVIKNVFIIDEIKEKQSSISNSLDLFNSYYIEVHKDYFKRMNLNEIFEIYPNKLHFTAKKTFKRKNYEISY